MIIDFRPEYTFISTGEKIAMYTLRVAGTAVLMICGERSVINHSYYIRNLSTDREKALSVGAEISGLLGHPFKPNADFDLNEIKRINAEESKERREAIERDIRERTEAAITEYKGDLDEGILLIGKYVGRSVTEVGENDPEYLRWLAGNAEEYSETDESIYYSKFNASALIALKWVRDNPRPTSEWIGNVGDKIEFTAKLTKIVDINGQFPTSLFRFVNNEGSVITTYSTAKKMEELHVGDEVTIKATVKRHENSVYEEIDNDKVTIVNRPKVI